MGRSSGTGTGTIAPPGPVARAGELPASIATVSSRSAAVWPWRIGPPLLFLAITIVFVWPLPLALLAGPLLKQRIKRRDIVAVLISFFGVLVISTRGRIADFRITDPLGVALATGSSLPWALFWIYNMKDKRDPAVRMFLNFAFASVYALVLLVISGEMERPGVNVLLGVTYVGLVEMGITFLIWLKALKLSRTAAHVTNLIYLVPFLSLIVIYLVLGERILPATIVGAVFIVGGIAFQKLPARR